MDKLERINMKERRFYSIDSFETIHELLYRENSSPKVIIT